MPEGTCSIDGCSRPVRSQGWCNSHYQRWWKHGDPIAATPRRAAASQMFIEEAAAASMDECLPWPFSRDPGGYGQLRVDGHLVQAHRAVLMLSAGPAPDPAMQAAHAPLICHNRACVNPRHLRWATRAENMADTVDDDTHRRGERSNAAKMTREQVLAIRSDGRPGMAIAQSYGISTAQVSQIKNRKRWAWLD